MLTYGMNLIISLITVGQGYTNFPKTRSHLKILGIDVGMDQVTY
jgi:hypothetical protein